MNDQPTGRIKLVVTVIAACLLALFIVWLAVSKTDTDTLAPEVALPTDRDCEQNRQCFYEAFVNEECLNKEVKITRSTIEGGPVATSAKLLSLEDVCTIEVTVDGSQDRYGSGKIHTYTCTDLIQEDEELVAKDCSGSDDATEVVI